MPAYTNRIPITFICRPTKNFGEDATIFKFYPGGRWDGCNYSIEDAIKAYPPNKYNWINVP